MLRALQALVASCIIVAFCAATSNKYTVRKGDSLSGIAAKFHVSTSALLKANHLASPHRLSIGMQLSIPGAPSSKTAAAPAKTATYTVRKDENDWIIAKRAGVNVGALQNANPGVHWNRLQIGQKLRLPGVSKIVSSGKSSGRPVKAAASVNRSAGGRKYTVIKGDNDWVIASRLGTTPSKLRAANPNVRWTRLQIGQTLNAPSGARYANSGPGSIRSRTAIVAASVANLRKGPGKKYSVVASVRKGTSVAVLDRESDWYKLKLSSGRVGWVRGDLLKQQTSSRVARSSGSGKLSGSKQRVAYNERTGNAAVDKALSMIGTRYRWAMSSRSGTDCSGLTTYVYRSLGVSLPRRSSEQARVGGYVAKTDLRPGDLVFFRTNRGTRINHVGIYKGNGMFVHASSSKGSVRQDSLNDGYYLRRYATARRVKGAVVSKSNASHGERDVVAENVTEPEIHEKSSVKPVGVRSHGTDEIIK